MTTNEKIEEIKSKFAVHNANTCNECIDKALLEAYALGRQEMKEEAIAAVPERPCSDEDYTVEYRVCREQTLSALASLE